MAVFTDQLQRPVELSGPARRIVSLVPSQTELLDALGAGEQVVGVTRFCVRPRAWLREKRVVGGTKQLDLEAIRALRPDLILGNREENERAQMEALMGEFNVWMSDILTLEDALAMIREVGRMTGRGETGGQLGDAIGRGFAALAREREMAARPPVPSAYLIWRRPYMVAGSATFIDAMMQRCGLKNVFAGDGAPAEGTGRYPRLEEGTLRGAGPELVMLSSEPYPFRQQHLAEFEELFPGARVLLVDGEMFSWYGPRLLHAPAYFRQLLAAV